MRSNYVLLRIPGDILGESLVRLRAWRYLDWRNIYENPLWSSTWI